MLQQVSELELHDAAPVVASCRYCLCVLYCRLLLLRTLRLALPRLGLGLRLDSNHLALPRSCPDGKGVLGLDGEGGESDARAPAEAVTRTLQALGLGPRPALPALLQVCRVNAKF